MPRKITKKETGVYEKEPGSGVWWVRFKSNGVTRREKIGRRGDAIAAYKDRKTSILRGEKLPATMKNRGIRLREIGQDAIDWCTPPRIDGAPYRFSFATQLIHRRSGVRQRTPTIRG